MKPAPTINEDFLRPPVDSHAPKQKSHLFLWTVFILLLLGFSMASWVGSYLVFGRPETALSYKILRKLKKIDPPQRFKVQEPPKGEFLGPEKIYNRFSALKSTELRQLNVELERSYLRNYQGNAAKDTVPYVTGRFTILDSYELGAGDFVPSGVVTLAVASDYPKLLIEHLYCAPAKVAPVIKRNLQTGMDIELRRTYELTAVLHASKLDDGHLLLTVVPLNYGSYVFKGADGGFSLEPPTELNVAAGFPVIRGDRYKQANDAYVSLRTKSGFGPLTAYRETDKKPDTVLRGVDPTPEPSPSATPAPSVQVAQNNATPGGKPSPAGKKPTASPTPALVALNSTPTPKPTAPPVVKATGDNAVSLQPFLQAPSTTPTPAAGLATPTPAVVDNSKTWRTYEPGQQPAGKRLRMGEVAAFHDRGGLNGETVYLSGQFTVRAFGENKARGIRNAVLRSAAEDRVRIIVEYPADRPLPAPGTDISRDEQRPFLITHIQAAPDASGVITLNVYAREIMN